MSDRGSRFQSGYRAWCRKRGLRPRFGAIGQHGSIAVAERFILSMKNEFLRRILVPYALPRVTEALSAYQLCYNEHRPHERLGGATPGEVLHGELPAAGVAPFEPRARHPHARGDPDVAPPRRVCTRLELVVDRAGGIRELPIVQLREAA